MTQLSLMLYFSKTARNFLTILTLHKVDNISFQMRLGSHLAALVWQTGVHRNVARIKMWYGEIWSEADMTQLSLMLYFSKTARNFFKILSLNIVDNIPFQMSLGSHLAALVWQTGVHTNVARNKDVIWRNLAKADMTQLSLMLYFSKTAQNFFTILSLNIEDNISFQMSLGSHLAALVWQIGVHTNVARNKDVIWRILVGSWHDTTKFDVILFKNGSIFSHNTCPSQSRQYFLSNELGQPFSRAGLTDWRS